MSNAIATTKLNKDLNGIEIYFSVFPTEGTRNTLKKHGFRWNHKKGCWYAKQSEDTLAIASVMEDTTQEEYKEYTGESIKVIDFKKAKEKKQPKKITKANKFGVKVGDFFYMSWGYEQTNINYFQVIELVGETSVRVREVSPAYDTTSDQRYTSMSEDRNYKLDTSKILPPTSYSSFIKDQEKGDLKRLKSYRQDGTHPQFYVTSYADAYYCDSENDTHYVSWYY